eukprot:1333470-Pyramimonas_sp.AAC.1
MGPVLEGSRVRAGVWADRRTHATVQVSHDLERFVYCLSPFRPRRAPRRNPVTHFATSTTECPR